MTRLSVSNLITKLIQGLGTRNIDFVVSEDALGCNVTEVFVTEAQELILFPIEPLDTASIQWILQIRSPLKVRITIFSTNVSELRVRILSAISRLKKNGLDIPQSEQAISVQYLTEKNIHKLLDSLEHWANQKINESSPSSKPLSPNPSSMSAIENQSSNDSKLEKLHIHLRNAIKTYWTERYFARYLNMPAKKVKVLANRIGIQREICGHDTLYFFERKIALTKYFSHIIKGVLDELDLEYREESHHIFFLPALHLALQFFDGEQEQLEMLDDDHVQNRDMIIILPETLRQEIGQNQTGFFQVLPLDQDKIKTSLIKIVRQRINYIHAYSSGI